MERFNHLIQTQKATPVYTWQEDGRTFSCTLTCLGIQASGTGRRKRLSKAEAVHRWLHAFDSRSTPTHRSAPTSEKSSDSEDSDQEDGHWTFDRWVRWLLASPPDAIYVMDGDNSWNMVSSVAPMAQALYVVGGRSFPHKAPSLPLASARCCLERCSVQVKDAADMLASFRIGQLLERLGKQCPPIVILSKDGAFDMLRLCIMEKGVMSFLVSHPDELKTVRQSLRPLEEQNEITPDQEASRRNQALSRRFGRLPSCAFWDAQSVGPPETWNQWQVE